MDAGAWGMNYFELENALSTRADLSLLAYVKSNHPKVLEDIAAQGELSPELDGQIKDIMTKYTAEYSA